MPGVRVVEPPHEIKGFSYFMVWHPDSLPTCARMVSRTTADGGSYTLN